MPRDRAVRQARTRSSCPGSRAQRSRAVQRQSRVILSIAPWLLGLGTSCNVLSCLLHESVRRLGASRRVRLPLRATRTAPVILLRAKAALFAPIHAQPLDVLSHEAFDELQIVAPLGGRSHELRFQELVEPQQRRIALQLV